MWRVCRKTIFPRWHFNRQNPVDHKSQNLQSKVLILHPTTDREKYSNQNNEKQQHAHKRDKKCWEDPQFHFSFYLLETAGWVGTAAALCLNIHFKHIKHIYEHDRTQSSCVFSRNVLAMPKLTPAKRNALLNVPVSTPESFNVNKVEIDKVSVGTDLLADIQNLTSEYAAAVENSIGLSYVNKKDRKAFRYFQSAAKLGSSQAFYNLGLCYELGKGTRVNLNRAAFCYKQAALKGHGLASFNLAVYFLKGKGGLPVDKKSAKLLLTEAANKGVPEAQTYIGIEYLEEGKWFDAIAMFQNLSEKNIPAGQYYLGLCYENGWGVYKNEAIAVELFAKSAREGHQKATLKLANYYEEGKGGCHSDFGFASALYQILNDLGNKEGGKALSLLQAKQSNLSIEKSLDSEYANKTSKNSLRTSTSVPDFSINTKQIRLNYSKFFLPSHLDLMTSFISNKIDVFQPKPSFSVGEDDLVKKYSTSLLPSSLSTISHAMKVKT